MTIQAGMVMGGSELRSFPQSPFSRSPLRTGSSSRRSKTISDGAQSSPTTRTFRSFIERFLEGHDDTGHFRPHQLGRRALAFDQEVADLRPAELDVVGRRMRADLLVDDRATGPAVGERPEEHRHDAQIGEIREDVLGGEGRIIGPVSYT